MQRHRNAKYQDTKSKLEMQASETLLASIGRHFTIQCGIVAGIAVGNCASITSIEIIVRSRRVIREVLLVISFVALLDSWTLSKPLRHMVFGSYTGNQIEQEAEHVEGEDQGNDPLEHSCHIVLVCEICYREDDSQDNFDQDEDELDPEGYSDDPVVPVMDAKSLVFSTYENGAYDESGNK
jgi:hypothetical protein